MNDHTQNDYRTGYIIEKILDYLPGNPSDIIHDLSELLQNPEASISSKRASHLKQIQGFLKDVKSCPVARRAIQKQIYALKNPALSTSKINYLARFKAMIAYFYNLLKRPLCKKGQPA